MGASTPSHSPPPLKFIETNFGGTVRTNVGKVEHKTNFSRISVVIMNELYRYYTVDIEGESAVWCYKGQYGGPIV